MFKYLEAFNLTSDTNTIHSDESHKKEGLQLLENSNKSMQQNSFYDKLMESQMIQNYLNAKIFSENETKQQQALNPNSKKFSQNANLLNQQSTIPLPFNVVMSNLTALAGARNMFNVTQATPITQSTSAKSNMSILPDPQLILNAKYLPPNLKATNQFNINMQQQIIQQKNCRLDQSIFHSKSAELQNEENCDYLHKKSSPMQSDALKKDLIDS